MQLHRTHFDLVIAKEKFRYAGTHKLCRLIDQAGSRAGVSRGQAFEDFLACSVCALSREQMEDEYLVIVSKGYAKGESGRRGIDSITEAFATLIHLMEETRKDILGEIFEGAITYGEAGQFLTPETLCALMVQLTVDESRNDELVGDSCCGSGRMLLAYAERKRPKELIGQDIDLRCVKMTAINLALRNLYGYVLWGNSLKNEVKLAYRTGMNMAGGFIRFARPSELAERLAPSETGHPPIAVSLPPGRPTTQLKLF